MLEIIASPIVLRTTAPAHSNLNRVLDGPSLSARKNASFSLSFLVRAHQRGADLLFQVISQRYERGSIIITSHCAQNKKDNSAAEQLHSGKIVAGDMSGLTLRSTEPSESNPSAELIPARFGC
jgi:hypothetical protein